MMDREPAIQPNWPPRFIIDQASILDLFTGETFYSSADASIREAILNAVDAIGRRQTYSDDETAPSIDVVFDRQSRTITVSDNGDGMGMQQISDLFARIGGSASRITSEAAKGEYRSVGEFGIGVLSYFLVCQKFEIHSMRKGDEPIGLVFSREMLDANTLAKDIQSQRNKVGSDLILFLDTEEIFDKIIMRFPHWIRGVCGLRAIVNPEGAEVCQGGISREIKEITPETLPDWIHEAHIGPPVLSDRWEQFDGSAHVDILYRGVFVASIVIPKLWAIEGAIHVDPKHFRPKLNREGFVGDRLQSELDPFLHACHPAVLERALECVREVLPDGETPIWTLGRWVTLWLAVPRGGPYETVAQSWDEEFRARKTFRRLSQGEDIEKVSVKELEQIGKEKGKIYIAPLNLRKVNHVTQQAVRVLRNSGEIVIQGVSREESFLKETNLVSTSTGDLLIRHFRDKLPSLIQVESVEREVIERDTLITLFDDAPLVQIVKLGPEAAPVLPVDKKVWINIDCDAGREVIKTVCARNEGHMGLWVASMKCASQHAPQIANILRKSPKFISTIGPIKRQCLLRMVE